MPRVVETVRDAKNLAKHEFRAHPFRSSAIAVVGSYAVHKLSHGLEQIETKLIDQRDKVLWTLQDRAHGIHKHEPTVPNRVVEQFEAQFIPALAEGGE